MARREGEDRQRQELEQADQAEVERGVVDRVDLPADGDRDHLASEPQREQRDDEEREAAPVEDGREVPPAAQAQLPVSAARMASSIACGLPSASTWTTVWRPSIASSSSRVICHSYVIEVAPTAATVSVTSISSSKTSTRWNSASTCRRGRCGTRSSRPSL